MSDRINCFGFSIRHETIGTSDVFWLAFDWIDRTAHKHRTVEIPCSSDPWFAANHLREMANAIERIECEAKDQGKSEATV